MVTSRNTMERMTNTVADVVNTTGTEKGTHMAGGGTGQSRSRRRSDRVIKKPAASVTVENGVTLPRRVSRPPKSNPRLQALKPGTTLGEIARACDLKVDHVSRIFNLKRRPKIETANKIAAFLGIPTPVLYHALGVNMVA